MSGRSGRRRGSQKPGTACGAASTGGRGWVCACAAATPTAINADTTSNPASQALMVRCGLAMVNGTLRYTIRPAMRGPFYSFRPSGRRSEIPFQILGGFFRRPFQVEGRDEIAVAIHQIDQRGMVHGVV